LEPSRTGPGGLRHYDEDGLVCLQRTLLLRELGVSRAAIADVLAGAQDVVDALRTHLVLPVQEQEQVDRRTASVRRTIERKEVNSSWQRRCLTASTTRSTSTRLSSAGATGAYAAGDRWWRGPDARKRRAWQDRTARLGAGWTAAAAKGLAADSNAAQALACRHVEWLGGVPGTPGVGSKGPTSEYIPRLADMYVADPRFGANYGDPEGAGFVRSAVTVHSDRHL
jgi:DNA-binding transcriptional MerR regulator